MGFFSNLAASTDLVQGMATRLGRNTAKLVTADPEIAGYRYRQAVLRCRSCTHQAECTKLQSAVTTLDSAPSYCRNSALFETYARR